jgi:2-polyprenyl-3-methyl-5-hydroxy-6-metoxy-1,4-benzoquinol methylase
MRRIRFTEPGTMIFPDVSRRDRQRELMDDPGISDEDHRLALRGLARLNQASGIVGTVWRELKPFARGSGRPLRVLDVACGSGDLAVGVGLRAARAGVPVQLWACDFSATALHATQARGKAAGIEIRTFQVDVTQDALEGEYDAVMSHLFFHHLEEDAIVSLLRRMDASAARLVLVTDLIRDRRGYSLAWLASRVLTRSKVVHTDALLSVRAALRPTELMGLADRAGLGGAAVRQVWPRRMVFTITKGGVSAR